MLTPTSQRYKTTKELQSTLYYSTADLNENVPAESGIHDFYPLALFKSPAKAWLKRMN